MNTLAFLLGGRFLELGRRLTGLSYVSPLRMSGADDEVSATHVRSQEKRSYEPLGVLLALPLVFRLLLWYRGERPPTTGVADVVPVQEGDEDDLPASSTNADKPASSDRPNTYLTSEAQEIDERQCTLCLEPRGSGEGSAGTVAVTECGHAFCWGCLGNLDKVSTSLTL